LLNKGSKRAVSGGWAVKKPGRNLVASVALTIVYFVAGKLSLALAFVHPSATAVWACSGITLATFLTFGYEFWPSILLASFLVNLTTAGSVVTSIGVATGNTLEGLVGAYLVNRFAGGRNAPYRARDLLKFAFLAGMLSTAIAATIGVTTLSLGGFANWNRFGPIWLTWWLGDAVGDLVVGPLLILWTSDHRVRWRSAQLLEALTLLVCLVLVTQIVFDGSFIPGTKNYPLEYLCIPFLIWAALRFGQREAAVVIVVLSGTAIWGTLHGLGPFARESSNESLLLLQAFLGVVAVMTMAFAAQFAELQRAEEQARFLAVSDPLTGLGNYRKLIDTLNAEIKRSDRTGRCFALLLMDLDGLKKINDVHGHLVGSRALCRLARILRLHSRGIDTAARYGGDEFALVIPEAGTDVARQVARRISERLASDGQHPALSASVGAAVCPKDGETIEMLIRSADRALYAMKRRAHRESISVATGFRSAS
jgi:diguanylate cyclase (GGDEF)-like protein